MSEAWFTITMSYEPTGCEKLCVSPISQLFLTLATPPPLSALGCFWLYKKLQASRSECTVQLDLRQRRVLLPFIPSVMQGMGRYLRIY